MVQWVAMRPTVAVALKTRCSRWHTADKPRCKPAHVRRTDTVRLAVSPDWRRDSNAGPPAPKAQSAIRENSSNPLWPENERLWRLVARCGPLGRNVATNSLHGLELSSDVRLGSLKCSGRLTASHAGGAGCCSGPAQTPARGLAAGKLFLGVGRLGDADSSSAASERDDTRDCEDETGNAHN